MKLPGPATGIVSLLRLSEDEQKRTSLAMKNEYKWLWRTEKGNALLCSEPEFHTDCGVLSDSAGSAEGSRCRVNACVGVEGVYEHNK